MITVEHVTDTDAPELWVLVAAAGLPLDGLGQVPTDVFVALDGTTPVGVAALEHHGQHGLLRSVAVGSEWRGQGIGSVLVDAAEHHARLVGMDGLYLLTETAVEFFAARGYEVIGRDAGPASVMASVEWSQACCASAVAMVLR